MRYGERSDDELVTLARQGWAPAFATLLHRHGDEVLAAVDDRRHPREAVTATYLRAMRGLDDRHPVEPVERWLLRLSTGPRWRRRRPAQPSEHPRLSDADRDHIWQELRVHWPRGRRRRRVPPVLIWLATLVAIVAVSAGVPLLVLGDTNGPPEADQQVRAVTIDRPDAPAAPQPEIIEEPPGPLPEYEFPAPTGDDAAAADPAPSVPTSGSAPAPAPTPAPDGGPPPDRDGDDAEPGGDGGDDAPPASGQPDPEPAPAPEPDPEPDPAPAPEPADPQS